MNLENKSIREIKEVLIEDHSKIESLKNFYLDNIEKYDNFSIVVRDNIDKEIERLKSTDEGLLYGIPFAVTDDISTKGIRSMAGSKMLENYIPPFNASAVEKLLNENALLLGKVDVEDFGLDSSKSTEVIANKEAKFVLGTDSASKTRNAAIYNGLVSYKPSYGLISRSGSIGLTSTLDQFSLISDSLEDIAYLMDIVKGKDEKDSTSLDSKISYLDSLDQDSELKLGLVGDVDQVKKVRDILGSSFNIEELDLDFIDYNEDIFKILLAGEAASNTSRFDGIRYGYRTSNYEDIDDLYKNSRKEAFSGEIKKQILFGNFVMSSKHYDDYYKKAQEVRTLVKEKMDKVFKDFDIIIYAMEQEDENYKYNNYSLLPNIVGSPVVAMNLEAKLGIHIIGESYRDEKVLELANKIENIL